MWCLQEGSWRQLKGGRRKGQSEMCLGKVQGVISYPDGSGMMHSSRHTEHHDTDMIPMMSMIPSIMIPMMIPMMSMILSIMIPMMIPMMSMIPSIMIPI